jgi:hypothetical protein
MERVEAFLRETLADVENTYDRSVALSESMTATRMGLVEKAWPILPRAAADRQWLPGLEGDAGVRLVEHPKG